MAHELQARNIHVAQVVIDGGINNPERPERPTERGPTVVSIRTRLLRLISTFTASTAAHGPLTSNYAHGRKSFSTNFLKRRR
jgi:hypothetical protein